MYLGWFSDAKYYFWNVIKPLNLNVTILTAAQHCYFTKKYAKIPQNIAYRMKIIIFTI